MISKFALCLDCWMFELHKMAAGAMALYLHPQCGDPVLCQPRNAYLSSSHPQQGKYKSSNVSVSQTAGLCTFVTSCNHFLCLASSKV